MWVGTGPVDKRRSGTGAQIELHWEEPEQMAGQSRQEQVALDILSSDR